MTDTVHQLNVVLRGVTPPVWRRVLIPSDTTLDRVAAILSGAMGWYYQHMCWFEAGDGRYAEEAREYDAQYRVREAGEVQLVEILPAAGASATWLYDFGDNWSHELVVERVIERDAGIDYPLVVAGERACPPEDCGGPAGYAEMLTTLANRAHPQRAELVGWLGGEHDPTHFDPGLATAHVNSTLRSVV